MPRPAYAARLSALLLAGSLTFAAAQAGRSDEGGTAYWDPDPGISVGIQEPADGLVVGPGAEVALRGTGWDEDTRWDEWWGVLYVPDALQWSWTSTGGTFLTATDLADVRWRAPQVNGTYRISLTADDSGNAALPPDEGGTRDDPAPGTRTISIRVEGGVSVTWYPDQAIQSFGIASPADGLTVAAGTRVQCSADLVADQDRRLAVTSAGVSTTTYHINSCTYSWSASGGAFLAGQQQAQSVTWVAPAAPGMYSVQLVVDDAGNAERPAGEGGTRDDPALPLVTVTITVVSNGVTWNPDTPINCAGITSPPPGPRRIFAGGVLQLQAASASDQDLREQALSTSMVADPCSFRWSATGGILSGAEQQFASWQAPAQPGNYRITLRAADAAEKPADEGGSRDDPDLEFTLDVEVVARLSIHVDWTSDHTTNPVTRKCSAGGQVAGNCEVRVRLEAPPDAVGATVKLLRIHEEAGHTTDYMQFNQSVTESAPEGCSFPPPYEAESRLFYYSFPWPTPRGHNGRHTIQVYAEYQVPAQGGGLLAVLLNQVAAVDTANLVILGTTPVNPEPIRWDPAQGQPFPLSVTARCASRAFQPFKLAVYDAAGKLLRTEATTLAVGGTTTTPFPWDGKDQAGKVQPKGYYLFRWEVGTGEEGDTDKSKYLQFSSASAAIVARPVPALPPHLGPRESWPAGRLGAPGENTDLNVKAVRATYTLVDSAPMAVNAAEAFVQVYEAAPGPFLGGVAVRAPGQNQGGTNSAELTVPLRAPQEAQYLFCARDGHQAEHKGHLPRWALQGGALHSYALAYSLDFEKYAWPGPRHTIPYARHAAWMQGGPLKDGSGYFVQDETNIDAKTALNRMKEAAVYFSFGHGGAVTGWGIKDFYVTFWQYLGTAPHPDSWFRGEPREVGRWTYLVRKTEGRDTMVARTRNAVPPNSPITADQVTVLDELPANSFSKMKLAVLCGCMTAAENATTQSPWGSPTHAMVEKGAKTAVGFRTVIGGHSWREVTWHWGQNRTKVFDGIVEGPWRLYQGVRVKTINGAQEWSARFWHELSINGEDVTNAAKIALEGIPTHQNLRNRVIAGDPKLIIAPAGYKSSSN